MLGMDSSLAGRYMSLAYMGSSYSSTAQILSHGTSSVTGPEPKCTPSLWTAKSTSRLAARCSSTPHAASRPSSPIARATAGGMLGKVGRAATTISARTVRTASPSSAAGKPCNPYRDRTQPGRAARAGRSRDRKQHSQLEAEPCPSTCASSRTT